jgi:hypothetical protein
MNTNHALQIALRSLILVTLTAGAAACGAAPEGQNTVDEKSLTESPTDPSDPDAAAPASGEPKTPPQQPTGPGNYEGAPTNGGGPSGPGGRLIPTHPMGGDTRS